MPDYDTVLASKQFVAATAENQGASMEVATGRLAEVGKDHGWMVGGHPDVSTGKQIPGRKVRGDILPLHEAHSHLIKAMISGAHEQKGYVGSWDDHKGNITLDTVSHVDKMSDARALGNQRGQEAIFGLQHHHDGFGNEMELRRGRAVNKQKANAETEAHQINAARDGG